jgi:hypothetical protein
VSWVVCRDASHDRQVDFVLLVNPTQALSPTREDLPGRFFIREHKSKARRNVWAPIREGRSKPASSIPEMHVYDREHAEIAMVVRRYRGASISGYRLIITILWGRPRSLRTPTDHGA